MALRARLLFALSALLVAVACSSSDDSAQSHPDAGTGGDASVAEGGASGAGGSTALCVAGSDCSGCDTCQSWCECLAPSSVGSCLANCNGSSLDAGGAAGSAGSDAGASVGEVKCGSASCSVAKGEECCIPSWNPGSRHCNASGTSCLGTRVRCDGPEDCGSGQVCCARLASNGQSYVQLLCRGSCSSNETEVCTSSPNVCSGSKSCQPSTLLPSESVCK